MADRPIFTEQSLCLATIIHGGGATAGATTAISAAARLAINIAEIVSAQYSTALGVITALTVVRVTPVADASIQLDTPNSIIKGPGGGTDIAVTDWLIMQCRMGTGGLATGDPLTREAKFTERALAIFTVVRHGVIALNTSTAIASGLRGGLDIGEIVSAYDVDVAGTVTSLTVEDPSTGAVSGVNKIKLDSANANQIILNPATINTDMLIMQCRSGVGVGTYTDSAKFTEKGLSDILIIFSGGATGAATTAIASAMRAGLQLERILSAEIHDRATGGLTALTVKTATPTGSDEIQLDTSTSFIRGAATPGDDIPADDQVWIHAMAMASA